MIKVWKNGQCQEVSYPTPAELAEMQAEQERQERQEREYWANIPYDEAVDNEIRHKYPQRDVEAILNNYLAYPDNDGYVAEFQLLQKYREECKTFVKQKKGMTEVIS